MRALVPNPEKSLVPGQYVQVRLRLTENPNALVIPEKTVGTDQGGSFVYVVGPDQTVEQRYVETGAKFQNGLLVVDRGLKAGEQVIIEGLQRVRPGLKVEAKLAATKDDARAEASEK
jgi:membrane fusion protein (multidrug efflux system)